MQYTKDLLKIEKYYSPLLFGFLFSCAVTGASTYLIDSHSIWIQWTVIAHLLTGITITLLLLPYLFTHIKRTIGFRRAITLITGFITIPTIITFIYTGLHLMIVGQRENQAWILNIHIVSSFLFLALLILHLIIHIVLLPKKRKNQTEKFPSLTKTVLVVSLITLMLTQMTIAIASYLSHSTRVVYSDQPVTKNYSYDYGPHRFRPSQTETSNDGFIDPRQIANSDRCLTCHQDIGSQWLASAHQQAASDPTYVTNVSLLANNKGISATRYCEGCHAPIALLSGELSEGGNHGGIAGTPAFHQGISCMGCHGIKSLTHLKGVASYQFSPANDYLFENSDSPLLSKINALSIRLKPDQHKLDMGNPLLKDPKFCGTCHTQFMDKDMNNWGWVKMQDEYSAWLESPYSKQNKEGFSNAESIGCNNCHMPKIKANDPSANYNGEVRAHHFPGANTVLPLLRGDHKHLQETIRFLQSNKMRLSIETPNRKDALQTRQAFDESLRNYDEAPYYYYLGESAELNVVVSNNGVGHNFPGGTIDINEAWIEFSVVDAEGRQVFSQGHLDENNFVDPNAYFYISRPIDRNGQEVWKHDLFNRVGEAFKRVVKAGESDIVHLNFAVPSWAKSPLTVTSTLKYRKFNERYARWALKEKYRTLPIVDMAWDSLIIPLKTRKEVETNTYE